MPVLKLLLQTEYSLFTMIEPYLTADGSTTLFSKRFGAHYHSLHGAILESQHIFITAGLQQTEGNPINLLEVGLGTGLNAALTAAYALEKGINVNYWALELYPLSTQDMGLLNYSNVLSNSVGSLWESIGVAPWETDYQIFENFRITKLNTDFTQWQPQNSYNLIYFDAFAPNDQPNMWQKHLFGKLFSALEPNGILVTYCVKGEVKNMLRQVGFNIERLAGPPGKKHMLRATKF